jgi:hypothetical protein
LYFGLLQLVKLLLLLLLTVLLAAAEEHDCASHFLWAWYLRRRPPPPRASGLSSKDSPLCLNWCDDDADQCCRGFDRFPLTSLSTVGL